MTKTPLGTLRHTKNKKIDRFSVQFYTSVKSPVIAFFTESLAPARLDTYYDDMTDREREIIMKKTSLKKGIHRSFLLAVLYLNKIARHCTSHREFSPCETRYLLHD